MPLSGILYMTLSKSLNPVLARLGLPKVTEEQLRAMLVYKPVRRHPREKISLDNYLSMAEAAKFLDVNEKTLRRWHLAGMGPPRHTHKQRTFYSKEELLNWKKHSSNGS
jgi:hypothetical protein